MPAKALYLKYRPRTFDQVDGQPHVTHTLQNALARGTIAHAYLFAGPRGTGKTTTARLLAKAVNCLSENETKPCNHCAICQAINDNSLIDLIEIDAASNTGVDDVRDLREKVGFRPNTAKYKVYIVDEAHMLSNAAFNALLKTLEEPPPHVIFVLATTEPQKIPATILSRTQPFTFRRITLKEIIQRVTEIAKAEGLQVEPAAIELIARQATGSLRDAISLLDQLTAYGADTITLAQVQGLLGAASHQAVSAIVAYLAEGNLTDGLATIGRVIDEGAEPRQLAREIVEYLRGVMLIQSHAESALNLTADAVAEMRERAGAFGADQILRAIRLFNQAAFEARGSASPTLPLEMAFVEALLGEETPPRVSPPPPGSFSKPPSSAKPVTSVKPSSPPASAPPAPQTNAPEARARAADTTRAVVGDLSLDVIKAQWANVLAKIRPHSKQVEAWLRGCEPLSFDGETLTLGFFYELHKSRIENQPQDKLVIEKGLAEVFGKPLRVKCVLSPKKAKMQAAENDPLIRAAVNQFGAQIVDIH